MLYLIQYIYTRIIYYIAYLLTTFIRYSVFMCTKPVHLIFYNTLLENNCYNNKFITVKFLNQARAAEGRARLVF